MLLATRIVLAKLNGSWNDISLPLIPLILPARSAIRLEAPLFYLSIYLPNLLYSRFESWLNHRNIT